MAAVLLRGSFIVSLLFLCITVVFIPWDHSIRCLSSVQRPWTSSSSTINTLSSRDDDDDDTGVTPDPGANGDSAGKYSCNADSPCYNGACCGKDGWCGFGPTYCGKGCGSNCDATAQCGQYSKSGDKTCPLNVCCSQFGFCGTTSEFCGTGCQSNNCGAPSRPKGKGGDVRDNIIGYHQSWKSSGDECGHMTPSQIHVDSLNAVNLAFAYITPDGVSISLPSYTSSAVQSTDKTFHTSFTSHLWNTRIKASSPRLPMPKRTALTPKSGYRGGNHDEDVKNYPNLLKIIKDRFKEEVKPLKLSITVPTSYWYLRWFDLPALAKHIDFFNLMSYDLHGTWDSTDPIGPHVYVHTKLTEIKDALDLFWREDISPDVINLGLAFYGRSFKLKDPSCTTPGCVFSGPGDEGRCTKTAGILSYREIEETRRMETSKSYSVHDKDAAVNWMVWGGDNWISYDTKETFQAKIDYANDLGLHGIFVWAIDQDTDQFTALQAVTGQDIANRIEPSDTLGNFDVGNCYITGCKQPCRDGYNKMTGLNQDSNGKGCPKGSKNKKQRNLCCPSWGAPDPSTCSWVGSWPGFPNLQAGLRLVCHGQLWRGQRISISVDAENAFESRSFCCPESPKLAAPGMGIRHRDQTIAVQRENSSSLVAETNPRATVGSGEKPFPLEDLFPYDIPDEDIPEYYESFDNTGDMKPKNWDNENDPSKQAFAWIIMSLDKRDGSHLELFDCPQTSREDFRTQSAKAVGMSGEEDNNCEDVMFGGVKGTIVRLPKHSGPDEWVRAVSFKPITNITLPFHLHKRAPEDANVYELECLASCRVASDPDKSNKRSTQDWREFHMSWFEERGYINRTGTTVKKRGDSSNASWWKNEFNALIKTHTDYGAVKRMDWSQVLYAARKSCPGATDASVEGKLDGSFETTLDYGISLICTPKNFNFDEAYAYFHFNEMKLDSYGIIDAYAAFQFQTQTTPILDSLDLFDGVYNIAGLVEIGPCFDVQAQLRAALTMSFKAKNPITWMYPKSMDTWPDKSSFNTYEPEVGLSPKTNVSVKTSGNLTVVMSSSLGFGVKLLWNAKQLVNTDISLNFDTDVSFIVTAEASNAATCNGVVMGINCRYGVDLALANALPGWKSTDSKYEVIEPRTVRLVDSVCKKWATGDGDPSSAGPSRREIGYSGLISRDDSSGDALFPDSGGSALRCPNIFNTPTGDCHPGENDVIFYT
ncbi:hypothetical protein B0T10DRAFT_466678 [Thelonectria olida]|uniref:chitinase n=1 Tax=Thelonectria olida TaxID=1576542 RepID=A0A9P8VTH9_9HYPO|nr:hypothetical protein B0T10DRAFT_466678 [Thelonectria olida]